MTNVELDKAVYVLNRRVERLASELGQNAPKTIISLEISLIKESLATISDLLENKSYIKE